MLWIRIDFSSLKTRCRSRIHALFEQRQPSVRHFFENVLFRKFACLLEIIGHEISTGGFCFFKGIFFNEIKNIRQIFCENKNDENFAHNEISYNFNKISRTKIIKLPNNNEISAKREKFSQVENNVPE